MRIILFDQLNYPGSLPTFDPFFTSHRRFQCVVTLEPDQAIDTIFYILQ
jgi:hypothetical protein